MSASHSRRAADLQSEVDAAVTKLRAAATDLEGVEVKSATGGLPKSVHPSISAFSNGRGGLVILGLNDADFMPERIDAPKLAADLASACSDKFEPAVRPEIEICQVDGQPVVVGRISPVGHQRRPCYLKNQGMERGSYIRIHDGDRQLNSYEIHMMVSGRGQPHDDTAPVDSADMSCLDTTMLDALLGRLRTRPSAAFSESSDAEVLHMVGVLHEPRADSPPTLAGLLALGRYPQQFFPQLGASFVVSPTMDGSPMADGTRFLDNQLLDGPVPAIVSGAVAAMQRNMRRRSIVEGAGREDVWDYPSEAVREIVANALMHRDYHPTAHGSPVRIVLYPDRFDVASPGGLHGIHSGCTDVSQLVDSSMSSTRNARLARLLEDVAIPDTGRTVCENRGSGLRAAVQALSQAGMDAPLIDDRMSSFVVTVRDQHFRIGSSAIGGSDRIPGPFDSDPWNRSSHGGASVNPSKRQGRDSAPNQIVELLRNGPRSSVELAAELGASKQSVLNTLRRMRDDGVVEPTLAEPRTRGNRWRLTGAV